MASLTTYLLVSGVDDTSEVQDYSAISDYDLEIREQVDSTDSQTSQVKFVLEQPVENAIDLQDPARRISSTFPDAIVVLCVVEERFEQVERLQTQVYRDGKDAGQIEHGYILNIGSS